MNIHTEKNEDNFKIHLDGDLDASSCLLLDKSIAAALEQGEKKLLVNCSKLAYISSAGLGVFMSYIQEFETDHVDMVLFELSDKVKNVFKILGLDELLKIVDTEDEAMMVMKI